MLLEWVHGLVSLLRVFTGVTVMSQRDEEPPAMGEKYQALDPHNTVVVDESFFAGKEVRRRRYRNHT